MTVKTMNLGPGKLTFGETTSLTHAETQTTSTVVKPTVKKGDPIAVLSGERAPGDRSEACTLAVEFLQDFGESGSFVEWTWANAGKDLPFEFIPTSGKGKAIRGICTMERSDIGGKIGEHPTATLELDCTTMPTIEDEIIGG